MVDSLVCRGPFFTQLDRRFGESGWERNNGYSKIHAHLSVVLAALFHATWAPSRYTLSLLRSMQSL